MLLTRSPTAVPRSTWAVLCLLGVPWLGLTTVQGSTLRPHGLGAPYSGRPMDFGQQRGYGLRSPPQVERRYQMGGFPTYTFPPPFGRPAQPSQPSARCPSDDASAQRAQSTETGVSPFQSTGVPGFQGGSNLGSPFFQPGLPGTQQGDGPTSQAGQGFGINVPSSLYEYYRDMYNSWLSNLRRGSSGTDGSFGLLPVTSRQESCPPGSSESLSPSGFGERSSGPPPMGGQQGQSGTGALAGFDQWSQRTRSPLDLRRTRSSGQSQSTGGPGNPSSSSEQNGQSPASSTPTTSTEGRSPEVTTSGPG
ncbi:unnamed protein product [Ixodes hexagonus]